jgi:electron transport complex protein RnfB
MSLVEELDKVLPQTQCEECGFPGCKPYAQAIAAGTISIDKCPPGGQETVKALAKILDRDPTPYLLNAKANQRPASVAKIREQECIGCTKCIQACPVDAIIGGAKHMHAIIPHECTGCQLCVEPCPVDCIDILPVEKENYQRDIARKRHHSRQVRHLRQAHEKELHYQQKRHIAAESSDSQSDKAAKKAYILEALARVKAKKYE